MRKTDILNYLYQELLEVPSKIIHRWVPLTLKYVIVVCGICSAAEIFEFFREFGILNPILNTWNTESNICNSKYNIGVYGDV